ncbi:MAG: S9 family peptidase [Gemmataceae bacterium]
MFLRITLVVLLLSLVQVTGAEKRPIAVEDLYRLDSPSAVTLAPDGKTGVYVRQRVANRIAEQFSLWHVREGEAPQPLEPDEPDGRAPVYSPDGKWLAFLSTRARPKGWKQTQRVPLSSDAACDIWLVPVVGGKAIPLAGPKKPYGRVFHDGFYGRLAFSPDGRRLAFVADDGADVRTREEIANDVQIVRPDQGEGYTGYGTAQVWIAHLDDKPAECAAGRIDRLTRDDVWYGDPQWTPDGKSLIVHANITAERESVRYSINRNFDLFSLDVATGKRRQLTTGPGPEVSPRVSPDGKQVLCLSVPRRGSHRDVFNVALVSLEGEPVVRVLADHHKMGPFSHLPPSFPLPQVCWEDDHHVVYTAEDGLFTRTLRLDLRTGKAVVLDLDKKAPSALEARLVQQRKLTPSGNRWLQDRHVAASERIIWKSTDGTAVDGILTVPPPSVAKPPFPLVVHPHGGPHSRSALGFDFTVQVLAGQGYAVFQPNFRGSSGYGQKFIDADRFDLGGGDMRDILSGVDDLIARKLVDADRLFVYGTSYGGFMTTWLVGQTPRFRAAVAQNAVTDLNMMWGLSDIQTWTEWEFGGPPWEVPDLMRKHSPISHVARVRTPTLILHARDDRRVPLPMGLAYHQALLARKVPTQMVIYPDEGHGIRQPRHREDVLRRLLAWIARHDRR